MATQAQFAPEDILGQWEDAMALARSNLERNRKQIEIDTVSYDSAYWQTSPVVATALWLDELGPAFGTFPEGYFFQYYEMEKLEAFAACLLEANAPKVVQTLMDAKSKLADLSRVTNFHTFKLVVDGTRRVPGKPEWLRSRLYILLEKWQKAWDPENWSIRHAQRRATLSSLKRWAEKIMIRAKALSYRPEDEEHWLEMEAMVLFRMHNSQGKTPIARASASRERQPQDGSQELAICSSEGLDLVAQRQCFNEAARSYVSVIAGAASKGTGKPSISDVSEMQVEVKSVMESLLKVMSDVQCSIQAEQLQQEKFKLVMEVSRLQEEKEKLEAAAASVRVKNEADRLKYEAAARQKLDEEKLRFNEEKILIEVAAREEARACLICLAKPHNVVIFPCFHAKYCEDCLERISRASNTCPICRAVITGTARYIL